MATVQSVLRCGERLHMGAIDPWNGVNALSITTSAIQMMGLCSETFSEEDHVRLHNVTEGRRVSNSVPRQRQLIETRFESIA